MERYDNIVRSAEIRKLVENKMYQKAYTILEKTDVNKVKILTDLSVYAEVYMQTEHYDEAKKLLLRIRAKSNSRRVIQQLIKLSIKTFEEEDAEYYYEEYLQVAPKDADKFILRYHIDRMKGADIHVLIHSLEQLKEYDYIEKWSYELAKLYHRAGMKDECVRECSDIILWFGEGVIVEKAKMLKEVYVGKPEHVETISAEKKHEIEQQQELLKTKDLSHMTAEVNNILNAKSENMEEPQQEEGMDSSAKEEKILENELNFEYNHNSIQDIPNIVEEPADYEYIYHNEALCAIFKEQFKEGAAREKIAAYLDQALVKNHANSFAIVAEDLTSCNQLAKAMAKAIHELHIYDSSKLVKISAEKLNSINLEKNYAKLENTFVVIEQASKLTADTMEQIVTMIHVLEKRIIVILEDTEEEIRQLLEANKEFASCFHGMLEGLSHSKEDLMELALELFANAEFELDEDAYVCLETACNQIAVNVVNKERISSLNKMIERVIARAEERSVQAITLSKGIIDYNDNQIDKIIASDF